MNTLIGAIVSFAIGGVFLVDSIILDVTPISAVPNTLVGIYLLIVYYRRRVNSVK